MADQELSPLIRHYFVDEAGDGTLFNRRKQAVVGKEGCSSYFMLGLLVVSHSGEHNKKVASYRYHPNQLYDRCVSRLFRDRLHKDDGYAIQFAKRGSRSRTAALQRALEQSRNNFRSKWGVRATAPIEVLPATPSQSGGLQAADYLLWALQRLYQRHEDRYWEYVAAAVSLVHDVDDIRNNQYGEYYSKRNPLSLASIKKPGI